MNHFYQVLSGVEGLGIFYLLFLLNKIKLVSKAEFEKKALLRYIAKLQADAHKLEEKL